MFLSASHDSLSPLSQALRNHFAASSRLAFPLPAYATPRLCCACACPFSAAFRHHFTASAGFLSTPAGGVIVAELVLGLGIPEMRGPDRVPNIRIGELQ